MLPNSHLILTTLPFALGALMMGVAFIEAHRNDSVSAIISGLISVLMVVVGLTNATV